MLLWLEKIKYSFFLKIHHLCSGDQAGKRK